MITIYGIKNCDTIKKTRKYFENKGLEYQFHDYRVDGIESEWLSNALSQLDWEKVLNKRGTTFRQLSQEQKDNINEANVAELLKEHPAMIKRPIIDTGEQLILGFYEKHLNEIYA